jgi:[1-hydroxy-2-(trimethylamino)ethyl]phosphonate dioxygenase
MNATVSHIVSLFLEKGHSLYGGEAVTQLQHALQSAALAEQEAAGASLITAALLHDVGHLLHDLPDDAPDNGVDDLHENLAARYLQEHFAEAVTEPVRLHVAAKRYLCATMPGYIENLSAPSLISLQLQGGVMNEAEVAEFEQHPYFKDAVALRHWDDTAKDPEMLTPDIYHFARYVTQSLK